MEVLPLVASLSVGLLVMLLVLFVALTAYIWSIRRKYEHVPAAPGNWFYVGHVPAFIAMVLKGEMLTDVLLRWSAEVGPIYVFFRLIQPALLVCDPDAIKELSTTRTPKPRYWHIQELFGERFSGTNVLTLRNHEEWKNRRRVLDPAFSINYLRSLVPTFNQVIKEELVDTMEVYADGKSEVDMAEIFHKTALQVISWVAFGTNFSNDEEVKAITGNRELRDLLITVAEGIFKLVQVGALKYCSSFYGGKYREASRVIRIVGRRCIEKRIKAIKNEEDVPQDLLTLILSIAEKEEDISIEDLVDEFVIFYGAGQETTSGLLSHSLVALLKHPEIMQSVIEEIDGVLGDKETVSSEDLDKLTYLHQVLEETLRLWPPLPYFARKTTQELTLCGYRIPKRTRVILSPYNMHRSSKYFDDPDKFDPCRFGPGQKRPSPYVYFPFGIGHRVCIGKNFAMMEAKVALALLLQKYSFQLPEDFEYKRTLRLTLQPLGKIPCTVQPKTRRNKEKLKFR